MSLQNKVALVTGAASGLGLGIADRFSQEGAVVALVDRDTTRGEAAAHNLQKQGRQAFFVAADLARPDEISRMVEAVLSRCGKLDIVVNNAATFLTKTIEQITLADWDLMMAVNLRAPFLIVQAALAALKQTQGNILNISSTAALRVFSPNLPYCTAKAGLITMTKNMAQELQPYRIRVNCLCPGAVDTPALRRDVVDRAVGESALDHLREQGYLTTPEQIASVALYLVSDEASAVTGSIMVADAGALLA